MCFSKLKTRLTLIFLLRCVLRVVVAVVFVVVGHEVLFRRERVPEVVPNVVRGVLFLCVEPSSRNIVEGTVL